MPKIPGVIVFKRGSSGVKHIGVYVGKDRIIEAKGKMYGVVVTQFSSDPGWNAWGMFDWLDLNLKESYEREWCNRTFKKRKPLQNVIARSNETKNMSEDLCRYYVCIGPRIIMLLLLLLRSSSAF